MKVFRLLLLAAWIWIIYLTVHAVMVLGPNWPAVAVQDLLGHAWRAQFNTDFIFHLLLLATWVCWREGANLKGVIFGVLSVVGGGLFSFPYLIVESYRANDSISGLLLGRHAQK